MTEGKVSQMINNSLSSVNTVQQTLDQFLTSADVDAVYAEPVEHGEHLVIPAAEVLSVLGFGVGSGRSEAPDAEGGGGGGGGGGRVLARPVAVIIVTPVGVKVEPVIDTTKIVMAFFTAFGFVLASFFRMRRGRMDV